MYMKLIIRLPVSNALGHIDREMGPNLVCILFDSKFSLIKNNLKERSVAHCTKSYKSLQLSFYSFYFQMLCAIFRFEKENYSDQIKMTLILHVFPATDNNFDNKIFCASYITYNGSPI